MLRNVQEVRNAIVASNTFAYSRLLEDFHDYERCHFIMQLKEIFDIHVPELGMKGTVGYLAHSKGKVELDFTDMTHFYPSDIPADEPKENPDWLYVCGGEMSLADTMKHMIDDSCSARGSHDKRTKVFLLTAKWNDRTFKDKEMDFIKYSIENYIDYFFLAVTDYGMYQVPFLPANYDSRPLDEFRRDYIVLENGETGKMY